MNVNPLIKRDVQPLSRGMQINLALELMETHNIKHLPVVENGFFIGLITEELLQELTTDLFNPAGIEYRLGQYAFDSENHMFDAIAKISEGKLSLLPVVDKDSIYVGYINPQEVIYAMGEMLSIKNPGAIIVLEIHQNDYHLSQIAQIVESHEGRILASYLNYNEFTHLLEITLRINLEDLTGIIQTMHRYNYVINKVHHRSDSDLDLMHRYENLMKFLNM